MKLIDIGAFNGDSALHFISYPDIDSIDAYDPNPDYLDIWGAIESHYPSVKFYNTAVYTYKGDITYFKRPAELPLGSTIMKEKIQGEFELVTVPCVDILDILTDRCCLKLDAEGAEYDILQRIIDAGKSDLIDRLYVEWHDSKMTSDNSQAQIDITRHFGKRIQHWL